MGTKEKHCSLTQSRKRRKKILKEKEKGGFLERELMWCLGKQKGFSNVKCTGPKAIFSTNESVFSAGCCGYNWIKKRETATKIKRIPPPRAKRAEKRSCINDWIKKEG